MLHSKLRGVSILRDNKVVGWRLYRCNGLFNARTFCGYAWCAIGASP